MSGSAPIDATTTTTIPSESGVGSVGRTGEATTLPTSQPAATSPAVSRTAAQSLVGRMTGTGRGKINPFGNPNGTGGTNGLTVAAKNILGNVGNPEARGQSVLDIQAKFLG